MGKTKVVLTDDVQNVTYIEDVIKETVAVKPKTNKGAIRAFNSVSAASNKQQAESKERAQRSALLMSKDGRHWYQVRPSSVGNVIMVWDTYTNEYHRLGAFNRGKKGVYLVGKIKGTQVSSIRKLIKTIANAYYRSYDRSYQHVVDTDKKHLTVTVVGANNRVWVEENIAEVPASMRRMIFNVLDPVKDADYISNLKAALTDIDYLDDDDVYEDMLLEDES